MGSFQERLKAGKSAVQPHRKIIVPLDVPTPTSAHAKIRELRGHVGMFKVGLEMITPGHAPALAAEALGGSDGTGVFWDGKFDDISNTVGAASRQAADMKVTMFNVHASSSMASMKAAVENRGQSAVLAVTVLTSIGVKESEHIFGAVPEEKVLQFAFDALEAGVQGLVCSPLELSILNKHRELDGLLRVPAGVRPAWASTDDQKRVMTPGEAIEAGADYLVIGRPILNPPPEIGTSVEAAKRITEEIAEAWERLIESALAAQDDRVFRMLTANGSVRTLTFTGDSGVA